MLAAVFVFRLWFMTTLPLSGDEAYHWEWSRNLDLGYYDHPPLTAYLIRISTWLIGDSTELSARLPALIMLTGTAVVCFFFAGRLVVERGGARHAAERAGFLAGLLIMFAPIFAVSATYMSTDPPLIFFWTLTLFLLYRAMGSDGWLWWICAGLSAGFAMLSKFLAFFMAPAILVFLLVSPRDRCWIKRPHAYVAALCALLVCAPFLYWCATHGWATFMFNAVYRQKTGGFAPRYALEFLAGQSLLSLTPGVFLFAVYALWRMTREWRQTRARAPLFFALTSLVPLVYFLCASFQRRVGLHWPATAWIGTLVCLASLDRRTGEPIASGRLWNAALAVCISAAVALYATVHIPPGWLNSSSRDKIQYSQKVNITKHAERFGWRELGRRVSEVRDEMLPTRREAEAARGQPIGNEPASKTKEQGVFIICDQYGLAASVAFYMPDRPITHLWSPRRTHGENYRFWDDFTALKGMDAVFVTKRFLKTNDAVRELDEHFSAVAEPERLPIMVDGEEVRAFFLIRCHDFDGVAPKF